MFFECLAAEDAAEQGQCAEADLLIVDPPRKGLDPPVLQLLLGAHPSAAAPSESSLTYTCTCVAWPPVLSYTFTHSSLFISPMHLVCVLVLLCFYDRPEALGIRQLRLRGP